MSFNPGQIVASLPWYERAIAAVAPSYGVSRMQAIVQRHLFSYQAARTDRLFSPKTHSQPAESYQTARDRIVMMHEALDLVENFPPAKAVLSKFATFLTPTEYAPSTGDRAYDGLIAEYFHDWCKRCDVTGRSSFRGLVQLAAQARPSYGDCGFAVRRVRGEIRLQLVPGDRIGNPHEAPGTYPLYHSGVVVNEIGAPKAYRIFQVDTAGQYINPEDIEAENFFHYFDPFRVDQYRGVTDFHAVLRTARMLKEILEAEAVGVRYASQQAALIFNERGQAPARNLFQAQAPAANGQMPQQEESVFGTLKYLQHGDRVEVMPGRPSSAFGGFVGALMGDIALGLGGYPAGVLWGTADYKGPSVRAEFAQADRVNDRHQGILSDRALSPIAQMVILDGIARGVIDPPKRATGESPERAIVRATRGVFRFPPRLSIDTGRDSQARTSELSMGLTSPQEIAADDGKDAYTRAREKADFAQYCQELAKERGIPETSVFIPAGQQLPNTPAQAATVGVKAGEDAAQAQADSVPNQSAPDRIAAQAREEITRFLRPGLTPAPTSTDEYRTQLSARIEKILTPSKN